MVGRDAFSFIANQAALADIKKTSGGIYSERRFMLRELSLYDAVFVLPTRSGNFGFNAAYNGFNEYYEAQAGLAYGRRLGDRFSLGVQFNYYTIRIAGYGGGSALFIEAGALIQLTAQLRAGMHVYNPAGGQLRNTGEKLPFVYTTGLGYDASRQFSISVEMQKETDQPPDVNVSLQYQLHPRVMTRGGIATSTSRLWLGIGIAVRFLRVEVAVSYHPQLGATPGMMVLVDKVAEGDSKNDQE